MLARVSGMAVERLLKHCGADEAEAGICGAIAAGITVAGTGDIAGAAAHLIDVLTRDLKPSDENDGRDRR